MMKKHNKEQPTASKRKKTKPAPVPAGADQDIVGLLTVLVQKLTAFEAKLDMLLSRIPAGPVLVAAPKPQLPVVIPAKPVKGNRPMYKAICADCAKDCEVPFKPRPDRQVYCKECFSKRKNNKIISKPREADKPKQETPLTVKIAPVEKPKTAKPVKSSKKSAKIKKPAEKKKTKKTKK
jgi:CxxC-x17-CxxC domain-containing protein